MTRTIINMPKRINGSNSEVNLPPTINITILNKKIYVVGRTNFPNEARSIQAYFCGPDKETRLRDYFYRHYGENRAEQIISERQTEMSAEATLNNEQLKKILGLNGDLEGSQ